MMGLCILVSVLIGFTLLKRKGTSLDRLFVAKLLAVVVFGQFGWWFAGSVRWYKEGFAFELISAAFSSSAAIALNRLEK